LFSILKGIENNQLITGKNRKTQVSVLVWTGSNEFSEVSVFILSKT